MGFSTGKSSVTLNDVLSKVSEIDIVCNYLHINQIPIIINSPLRVDNKPSFGLYTRDGKTIYYTDFSTSDNGSIYDLLSKMWNLNFVDTITKIYNDIPNFKSNSCNKTVTPDYKVATIKDNQVTTLECKTREWLQHDIEYWESYGITIDWLKYADVYPISHKIINKGSSKYTFKADKYAYAYVEHKDNKVTLKIYQPYNKVGYKWANKHDSSVISLWTKIPKEGKALCICSSLKDALCLWINVGIPSIAVQGEGYKMSDTAVLELKKRFNNIFILFDNDEAGLKDGISLADSTGFTNLILPNIGNAKDISDLYLYLQNKKEFNKILISLFRQIKTI